MEIGIFAKTFKRETFAEVADTVVAEGIRCIQFNFACVGLPSMPDEIPAKVISEIRRETTSRQVSIAAVSGTFNLIHPNREVRLNGLRRLEVVSAACARLGVSVVTLCTGTRDPDDMWQFNVANSQPDSWSDLLESFEVVLALADRYQITFGVEPEIGNVVDSAKAGRRLLDELKSSRVKIVMDPANLFHPGEASQMRKIMDKAFELLGGDLILAHAKDFRDGDPVSYLAAGRGQLDFGYYLKRLSECSFSGPLIMHGLEEFEVRNALKFLQSKKAEIEAVD